jgi:hypothetical protein
MNANFDNPTTLALTVKAVRHLPTRSFQVVSLLDMIELDGKRIYLLIDWLEEYSCAIHMEIKRRGQDDKLTVEENSDLHGRVNDILKFVSELNNPEDERREEYLRGRFQRVEERLQVFAEISPLSPLNRPGSLGAISDQLQEIRRALKLDLDEDKFISISPLELQKYQQSQLFGPEVFANFPSTRMDVAEAGNCYALGRYTACVFHCMRVVEKGLHAFVPDLNARCNTNMDCSMVSYVQWGTIIERIEDELKKLLKPGKKPPLDPNLRRFYSETAQQFIYIKDAWRNDVTHSRSSYDEPMAYSIMDHVKAFMIYLCKHGLREE